MTTLMANHHTDVVHRLSQEFASLQKHYKQLTEHEPFPKAFEKKLVDYLYRLTSPESVRASVWSFKTLGDERFNEIEIEDVVELYSTPLPNTLHAKMDELFMVYEHIDGFIRYAACTGFPIEAGINSKGQPFIREFFEPDVMFGYKYYTLYLDTLDLTVTF